MDLIHRMHTISERMTDLIHRNRTMLTGLLVAAMISMSVQFFFVGDYGSDFSTTPDTMEYLRLAKDLNRFVHPKQEVGRHFSWDIAIRTPGYPLTLIWAAKSAGIDLAKVELPLRNIENTNPEGRALIRRVVFFHQAIGFLIPLLLFLLAFLVTRSAILAVFSSFAYYLDVSSMAFQFVLLTETLSIFFLLAAITSFVFALSHKSWYSYLLLGLVVTAASSLRPAYGLLTPIMLGAFFFLGLVRRRGVSIRFTGIFLAGAVLFPFTWATLNFVINGEFFVSKNQAITLQNFSGRYFVELELDDPDLQVLQKHVRVALKEANTYSMHRSFRPYAAETGKTDRLEFLQLTQKANLATIRAFPTAFLTGGLDRFRSTWTQSFIDPKNSHALNRRAIVFGPLEKTDRKLVFGVHAWWVFLGLLLLSMGEAVYRERRPTRLVVLLGFLLVFIPLYMFLTSLFDELECIRHSLPSRTTIHFVFLLGGGLLIRILIGETWRRVGKNFN